MKREPRRTGDLTADLASGRMPDGADEVCDDAAGERPGVTRRSEVAVLDTRQPFASATTSVATVRAEISWYLAQRAVPQQCIDDALVVASELVSNAVRHGRPHDDGHVEVAWGAAEGEFHVEVCDAGLAPVPLVPTRADPLALGGRGLAIVEALSSRWWASLERGTTVHAVVPLG